MDVPFLLVVLTNIVGKLMATYHVNVILGSNGMDSLVKLKVRKCSSDIYLLLEIYACSNPSPIFSKTLN
jgi:hypothetical protein